MCTYIVQFDRFLLMFAFINSKPDKPTKRAIYRRGIISLRYKCVYFRLSVVVVVVERELLKKIRNPDFL